MFAPIYPDCFLYASANHDFVGDFDGIACCDVADRNANGVAILDVVARLIAIYIRATDELYFGWELIF